MRKQGMENKTRHLTPSLSPIEAERVADLAAKITQLAARLFRAYPKML